MAKSYPRIGQYGKLQKNRKVSCRCGNPATHWVSVEQTYLREDDELFKVCDEHKRNLNFLIGKE